MGYTIDNRTLTMEQIAQILYEKFGTDVTISGNVSVADILRELSWEAK